MIEANILGVKRPLLALAALAPVLALTCPADEGALAKRALSERPAVVSDKTVLDAAQPSSLKIRIDLAAGELTLLAADKVALRSPVCAGRRTRPTPTGQFKVSSKSESLKADRFGHLVGAGGEVVSAIAYTHLDPVPPGLRFERVAREDVLHLGPDAPLIHAGRAVPVACSDGAVIVPQPVARLLFQKVPVGCPVEIVTGGGDSTP